MIPDACKLGIQQMCVLLKAKKNTGNTITKILTQNI